MIIPRVGDRWKLNWMKTKPIRRIGRIVFLNPEKRGERNGRTKNKIFRDGR